MIKIRVEGIVETEAELDKLGKPSIVKAPVQEGADMIKNILTAYPPYGGPVSIGQNAVTMLKAKPGSKYQRTGTLARGWKYRTREYVRSWAAFITNDVPYAGIVQDPAAQVSVHRGFWKTTDEALKETEKAIVTKYNRTFNID